MNRLAKHRLGSFGMQALTWLSSLVLPAIGVLLVVKAWPVLVQYGVGHVLGSSQWNPSQGAFGMFPFIMGSVWAVALGLLLAIPLCLGAALYLTEYARRWVLAMALPLIDMLAAIPSVLFGIFGVLIIVPFLREDVAPFFGQVSPGYSVLAAGIVLAIMMFPVVVNILLEVFAAIPQELRDAGLALGATQWETTNKVVLRQAWPGIISAFTLGISRAFGETLAVLMVAGNVVQVPHSVFDAGYPLTALIANNYGEMLSIPLYDSALMLAALVLFVLVLLFNIVARQLMERAERTLA